MVRRVELGASLQLEEHFIAKGRPNRKGTAIAPTSITVHNTSNTSPGADARANARFAANVGFYMHKGKKNWVSWHYTVDDKRVVKSLPINEHAIHAGSANDESIGIEICMNAGIDQKAAFDRARDLIACLLYDLKLTADVVRTHRSWTGKSCPTLLLEAGGVEGAKWNNFKQGVAQRLATITA